MTKTANHQTRTGRRLSGIYIFIVLIVVMVVINYRSSIAPIYCNAEVLKSQPEVIMLGTTWCPYCAQARKYFHTNRINYCEYDIEKSAEGERLYDSVNGGAIPILIIDGRHYTGFDAIAFEQLMKNRQDL